MDEKCKLNKTFLHFLSNFWHIWWIFKVRWCTPLWKIIKYCKYLISKIIRKAFFYLPPTHFSTVYYLWVLEIRVSSIPIPPLDQNRSVQQFFFNTDSIHISANNNCKSILITLYKLQKQILIEGKIMKQKYIHIALAVFTSTHFGFFER